MAAPSTSDDGPVVTELQVGGSRPQLCITIEPNEGLIFSGGDDCQVNVCTWDGERLQTHPSSPFEQPQGWVSGLDVSPTSRLLSSASLDDKCVRVYDVNNGGAVVFTFSTQSYALSCAFNPKGSSIVGGDQGGVAYVWRVGDGSLLATLKHNSSMKPIHATSFPPNNRDLVACYHQDQCVCFWDLTHPSSPVHTIDSAGDGCGIHGGFSMAISPHVNESSRECFIGVGVREVRVRE